MKETTNTSVVRSVVRNISLQASCNNSVLRTSLRAMNTNTHHWRRKKYYESWHAFTKKGGNSWFLVFRGHAFDQESWHSIYFFVLDKRTLTRLRFLSKTTRDLMTEASRFATNMPQFLSRFVTVSFSFVVKTRCALITAPCTHVFLERKTKRIYYGGP